MIALSKARARQTGERRDCAADGCDNLTVPYSGRGKPTIYCGTHVATSARRRLVIQARVCSECPATFTPSDNRALCCSTECRIARRNRLRREKYPIVLRTCTVCVASFAPTHHNQTLCSDECRAESALQSRININRRHATKRKNRRQVDPAYRSRINAAQRGGKSVEQRRAYSLRTLYGLRLADYEAMNVLQGGVCASCHGTNVSGLPLFVDHCATSGRVRGLLCHNCNAALGLLKESPERMTNLIDYVTTHCQLGQSDYALAA